MKKIEFLLFNISDVKYNLIFILNNIFNCMLLLLNINPKNVIKDNNFSRYTLKISFFSSIYKINYYNITYYYIL